MCDNQNLKLKNKIYFPPWPVLKFGFKVNDREPTHLTQLDPKKEEEEFKPAWDFACKEV